MTDANDHDDVHRFHASNTDQVGDCRVLRGVAEAPGIETLEGRLVPLLSGAEIRSHVIVMHADQYCEAHPHDSESLIYTISGRWVFCTTEDGVEQRVTIGEGDLFHFPADVPTGFETPFDEPATILIFKAGGTGLDGALASMTAARDHLIEEHRAGAVFRFSELPADHPARRYVEGTGSAPAA